MRKVVGGGGGCAKRTVLACKCYFIFFLHTGTGNHIM